MKFLQAYYTSCKTGQSESGFQFYSYTNGLSGTELNDIERLTVYNKPMGVSQDQFPISMQYKLFDDGKAFFAATKYIGQDYAGHRNEGNRFSHAIISEDPKLDFYPAILLKNINFKKELTEDEINIDSKPQLLDYYSISDSSLPSNEEILINISEILENDDTLSAKLKFTINATIDKSETKRRIVIADSTENIEFLITALNILVPINIAKNLSFKTYAKDPSREDFDIVGTSVEGSLFDFSNDILVNHQYYAFNSEEGIYSDNLSKFKFTDFIVTNCLYNQEHIEIFKTFTTDHFDYLEINKHIDGILSLFLHNTNSKELDAEEFNSILYNINTYGKGIQKDKLIEMIQPLEQIEQVWTNKDEANLSIQHIIQFITDSKSEVSKNALSLFWFKSWDKIYQLNDNDFSSAITNIQNHWNELEKTDLSITGIISRINLLDYLSTISELSVYRLTGIFNCATKNDIKNVLMNEAISLSLNEITKDLGLVEKLLLNLTKKEEHIPIIFPYIYNNIEVQKGRESLIEILNQVLTQNDISEKVESHFSNNNENQILFHLLSLNFAESGNKEKAFWKVHDNHFANKSMDINFIKPFIYEYLKTDKNISAKQIEKLIPVCTKTNDINLINHVSNKYESFLSFTKPNKHDRNIIKNLQELKAAYQIKTDHGIYNLLFDIYNFYDGHSNISKGIKTELANLKEYRNIDENAFTAINKWLMPILPTRIDNESDFEVAFNYINKFPHRVTIYDNFTESALDIFKKNTYENNEFEIFLRYASKNLKINDEFIDLLIQKLAKSSPEKLSNISDHYEIKFNKNKKAQKFTKQVINEATKISETKFLQVIKKGFLGIFKNRDTKK